MHRPDPKRAPELQDKRSVIPIAAEDVDRWLTAPVAEAAGLIKLTPPEGFDAAPAA
jgi:hypothetical protein